MESDTRRLARRAGQEAQRADSSATVRWLAKAGLVSRAFVYLVLTYLTVDLATSRSELLSDSTAGALQEVARQPAGRALLAFLAVGFAAYALWRLVQAAAGSPGSKRNKLLQIGERIGFAGVGAFYGVLCAQAVLIVVGTHSHGGKDSSDSVAAIVLGWPGGRGVLAAVGAGITAGGVGFAVWAARQGFVPDLRLDRLPAAMAIGIRIAGTAGQVVRGLLATAIGVFVLLAGIRAAPNQVKGVNATLRELVVQPFGPWLLAAVAVGFAAFALLSLAQARYGET